MRAILLAAGMGTRLRPLTLDTPKSLIVVNKKPLLERQIEMLREKGVEEIIVVTGYLNEKFEYLKDKYGVKLINNDKYDKYNNIYTMYLVREYLKDTYVIDADIYINENFLLESPETSTYFVANKKGFKDEWKVYYDQNNKLTEIRVESGEGYILSGVSYWSEVDGEKIVKKLEEKVSGEDFNNLYWDNIVKENIDILDIKVNMVNENSVFEIDNLDELAAVKKIVE